MANNRLEELRRRAQERIQEVRESMEREMDGPPPPPIYREPAEPPPAPAEVFRTGPAEQSLEGPSLEGPSLEGPGLETPRPQVEGPREQAQVQRPQASQPREQPRAQRAAPTAPPSQRATPPTAHHRGRHTTAAQILSRDTLRQAILAQEILGKPVSLRPPRETEDL